MKNTQKTPGQHGKPTDHIDKGSKSQRTESNVRMENKSDPTRSASVQHRQDEPGKLHAPERDLK